MKQNYLIFLFIIVVAILGMILIDSFTQKTPLSFETIGEMLNSNNKLGQTVIIEGLVKKGSQIEGMEYCSQGFYLTDDTGIIQLRIKDSSGNTEMFSDEKYIGKQVQIRGKYPAQESFCLALMCLCDNYMLVETINTI